ncbi:MAG TPA: hypothetical protein VFZ65_09915 [Planctomycetota bacterium]|nr:hypothetical protein [Planctomycetota bacterium]
MLHSLLRLAARLVPWSSLLAGAALVGQQHSLPTPLAVLECQVPNMDTFVVHGAVPLPPGHQFDDNTCPFSLYLDNTRLLTQWEPIAYRADGSLMTAEFLGVVPRGTMTVGSRQRFLLRYAPSADPDLSFSNGTAFVGQMLLRAKDVYGSAYEAALTQPKRFRFGAAQITMEYQARLVPVQVVAGSPLPQLGAAQVWISARAGTGVYEVVLNYHNGSSQHPTWNIYFKSLELLFPSSHLPLAMHPETMAGSTYIEGTRIVLPLIREIPNKMQFLQQRGEHDFRYFLYPAAAPGSQDADALAKRIGWACALDVETNPVTHTRSWSFVNSQTPGYFPQALPMPTLDHVAAPAGLVSFQKATLTSELQVTQSVGESIPSENPIFLDSCFCNPFGAKYGGATGGTNIHPFEGVETLWTGNEDGLLLAQMVMRCYQDRQPGAMYEDDGQSFRPDDPQYLNANGSQPYNLFDNVFIQTWQAPGGNADAPWEWDQTDRSHEQRVEAVGKVPPYRDLLWSLDPDFGWKPVDAQHRFRISRMMKMLVYLDNDPLARRRLEADCELMRAAFYDGPGGRLSGFLGGQEHIGGFFGREHAEAADAAAAAYATAKPAWRSQWKAWFDKLHEVLLHLQTPGGCWQAMTAGKPFEDPPFESQFRVCQPREHMFTMHALRAVKEMVYGSGVDTIRHDEANLMLIAAGQAIWRLMWRWHADQSGPDGDGAWDKVAVGPLGNVTPAQMYTQHTDHPSQQYLADIDSYQTGVGLTYWFAEVPPPMTGEMSAAMVTFWSSTNVLASALAQGIANIWNNAALIAYVQKNY